MPGRPRSEAARRAVLDATVELVGEDGYGPVTMEAIARRAGVSKQTLYRWWPGKAAILLEAINEGAARLAPVPDTGSLEDDLRDFVRRSVLGAGKRSRQLLAGLMAEAQLDEDFAATFRRDFLARRRAVLQGVLERARDRGDLSPSADPSFLAELAFATLWYRILVRNRPLDRRFADELSDALLALAQR